MQSSCIIFNFEVQYGMSPILVPHKGICFVLDINAFRHDSKIIIFIDLFLLYSMRCLLVIGKPTAGLLFVESEKVGDHITLVIQ